MTKKILVVDDEPDIAASISKLLELRGYDVDVANDGKQCLAKLKNYTPDLIIMDFFMPQMSGREAIVQIRKNKKYDKVKIIFMTVAEFRGKGLQKLKNMGISAYLSKPVEVKDLLATINEVIKNG